MWVWYFEEKTRLHHYDLVNFWGFERLYSERPWVVIVAFFFFLVLVFSVSWFVARIWSSSPIAQRTQRPRCRLQARVKKKPIVLIHQHRSLLNIFFWWMEKMEKRCIVLASFPQNQEPRPNPSTKTSKYLQHYLHLWRRFCQNSWTTLAQVRKIQKIQLYICVLQRPLQMSSRKQGSGCRRINAMNIMFSQTSRINVADLNNARSSSHRPSCLFIVLKRVLQPGCIKTDARQWEKTDSWHLGDVPQNEGINHQDITARNPTNRFWYFTCFCHMSCAALLSQASQSRAETLKWRYFACMPFKTVKSHANWQTRNAVPAAHSLHLAHAPTIKAILSRVRV